MNTTQLINAVAEKTAASKRHTKQVLETALAYIAASLGEGERAQLTGFGSFRVSKVAAKNSVNPQTKKKMKIPAYKTVRFRPSLNLKSFL